MNIGEIDSAEDEMHPVDIKHAVLDPELNDTSVCLDLLRYLAAQAVCVGHAISFFGIAALFRPPKFPYIQNFGVIIFFVLSGFVIAHALVRGMSDQKYGLGTFIIERTARIYSAYLPALMLIAGIDGALLYAVGVEYENYLGWRNFFGNVLMLQNYLGPFHGVPAYGSAGHLWSLAVEFHIYLFVGACVFVAIGRNWWLALALALISAPVPLAFFSGNSHGLPGTGLFILWLLGFAIYYICHAGLGRRIPVGILIAGALIFSALWVRRSVPGAEYQIENYAIVAIAFLAIVLATQRTQFLTKSKRLRNWVRFAANYSFSLYLLHYSILYCVVRLWPSGAELGALLGVVVSNSAAILFAYFTEFRHRALARLLKNAAERLKHMHAMGFPHRAGKRY